MKSEAEEKPPKQELSFIVNTTTEIRLIELKDEDKNEKKEHQSSFYGYLEELKALQDGIIHSLFNR